MEFKPLIKILIYVLDDEDIVLKHIRKAFETAGIENYVMFTKPRELIERFNEDVQICVTDIDLKQDLTGIDVAMKVRKMQPLVDCIFMSKMFTTDMVIDIANTGGRNRFVRKDKRDFLEKLVNHVKDAAVETDQKLRAAIRITSRLNNSIQALENAASKL